MGTRIFISHSAADANIGERFLNFLIAIGFKKEEIFYSSKYHNGVELGKNFPNVVRKNFIESEIIVFLLTENFYNSPFCLNEMGAAWISEDKEIVPILLGDLSYSDMKGFLGSQTKTFSPKHSEANELYSYFIRRTTGDINKAIAKRRYNDFLRESINEKLFFDDMTDEAKEILKELSEDSTGYAIYSDLLNVVQINCNGKKLCEGKTTTEKLKYKEAMEYLISNGYVERKKQRKLLNFIYLKTKGVQYAEEHSKLKT